MPGSLLFMHARVTHANVFVCEIAYRMEHVDKMQDRMENNNTALTLSKPKADEILFFEII